MTTRAMVLISILLLGIAPAAVAQADRSGPENEAEQAYKSAFTLENSVRNFEQALGAYDRTVALSTKASRSDLHVKALVGRGRCLARLGRRDEALEAYETALRVEPGNEEAKERLETLKAEAGRDDDLERRIAGLVAGLGRAEREQALKDLVLIGDRAVPALAAALRSRSVGTARGAAKALAVIGTTESFAALARGFGDEDIVFVKVLVNALSSVIRADRGGLAVFLAAMDHPQSEVRARALRSLSGKLQFTSFRTETAPAVLARILDRALTDPAAEPKAAALDMLQRNSKRFEGHDPIGTETWIEFLRSEEPDVSWAAAHALAAIRKEMPWEPELCRAIVDAMEETVAGKRPISRVGYYLEGLRSTEGRAFSEDDLLALYARTAASGQIGEDDRRLIFDRVENFLIRPRWTDEAALGAIARKGWSVIRAPAGRRAWLEEFARHALCPHDLLLEAAGDPSPDVRAAAYEALLNGWDNLDPAGVDAALRHVEEDLLSGAEKARQDLIQLLSVISAPSAAPAIEKFLDRHPAMLRGLALNALVKAAGEGALPVVREELAGESWSTARSLLVRLLGVEAVPELVALARRIEDGFLPIGSSTRGKNQLRVQAEVAAVYVAALPREMRDARLVETTAQALSAEARAELVIDALGRESADMLRAGARVAGHLHVEEAWPYLIPLLDHSDAYARSEATKALEAIRAYRELKSSFERYGPGGATQVLKDAIGLTKSDDPLKRRGGALAIGALGDAAGIPVLLGLLDDPDEQVKEAALGALERLGGRSAPPDEK